jgi:hypothetical protein
MVAGDYFTRWMEAYAIKNQEAVTVAKILTEEFFFLFFSTTTITHRPRN